MRGIVVATCLVLVASCGGDEVTLSEYAEEVEGLVTTMNRRLDDLDAEREAEVPTVESTQAFLNARVAARQQFLDAFRALEPSEEVTELHTTALGVITRLTAAEESLALRAEDVETEAELSRLSETPEGLAADAVDEEALAICQAAQAQVDATADREVFEDVPWIPSEMKEVVQVFFGCAKEERGGGS